MIAGSAEQLQLCLKKKRINLGRLVEVIDAEGRLTRKNDVAFRDDSQAPNPSVSRAHAHIEFDPERAVFRLFDDRSAHGTTVIRDGSVIPVPQGPSKWLALRHGDEIVLGQASLRFEEAVPNSFPVSELFSLTREEYRGCYETHNQPSSQSQAQI